MTRSLILGGTDFSSQSFEEMNSDLNKWISLLNKTTVECNKMISKLQQSGDWNRVDQNFKDGINSWIDFFNRAQNEIEEIVTEINIEVQYHHMKRLKRIGIKADKLHVQFVQTGRRDYLSWINEEANFQYRQILKQTFINTRELYNKIKSTTADLVELQSLALRMEDFIGHRSNENLQSERSGKNEVNKLSKCRSDENILNNHSKDFGTIIIGGEELLITPRQAEIVQYFYENKQEGIRALRQDSVLEHVNSNSKRLRDAFKSRPEAYKLLFRSVGKGMYELLL